MKPINRFALAANLLVVSFLFASAPTIFAAADPNVNGFAWSENIGWISFNSKNCDTNDDGKSEGAAGCPAMGADIGKYGVNLKPDGKMEGYAWSENIGWISFEHSDTDHCPSGNCHAEWDKNCAGGKNALSGWARVLSVAGNTNNGGWDGWIKLAGTAQNGSPYGAYVDASGDFHGFAWSDMVMGWINFNSVDCDGSNCATGAPYKVYTAAKCGPLAKMECGGICAGGYCDTDPNSTWIMYPPVGDCPSCGFRVNNASERDVQCTKWELVGTNYSYASLGKADHTFQTNVPVGTYQLKLTVSNQPYSAEDNPDCAKSISSSVTHAIQIKREALAGFKCSLINPNPPFDLDNPNPPAAVWEDCAGPAFKNKVVKGEMIYLQNNSSWSEDAGQINSFDWTIRIDSANSTGTGEEANFNAGKNNTIKLKVADSAGRSNCKIVNLKSRTLPKWQEVSPVGMIWQYLSATVSKIFATI